MISESFTHAAFYRDERGYLIPLIGGSFHNLAVINNELIIGIFIDDNNIHPIYNIERQQIVLTVVEEHPILMTEELHQLLDHYYVRLRSPSPPQRTSSRSRLRSPPDSTERSHQRQRQH